MRKPGRFIVEVAGLFRGHTDAQVLGSIPSGGSKRFKELPRRALRPKTPILQFSYTSVLARSRQAVRAATSHSWALAWLTVWNKSLPRSLARFSPERGRQLTQVSRVIEVLTKPMSWYNHARSTLIHVRGRLGENGDSARIPDQSLGGGSVVTRIICWGTYPRSYFPASRCSPGPVCMGRRSTHR